MKKTLLVTSLLSFAVVFSACSKQTTTTTPAALENQSESEMMSESQEIARAMASNQALQCTFTNKTNNQTMSYAVKGKSFRMDGTAQIGTDSDEQTHMISDGTYFYSWASPTNQGVKMAIPDEETLKEQAGQLNQMPDFSNDETLAQYENDYTINCEPASFDDSHFLPPTDVQFQDMSALMKNMSNQVPTQNSLSEEEKRELDALMQQYGN